MLRFLSSLRVTSIRLSKSAAQWLSLDTALLLLLSALMGFSLLSLAVHLIDRSIDNTLTVHLSPDGQELIQLRNTGLAAIDVETGEIKDQLRFVGVWQNALNPWHKRREFNTRPTFGEKETHRWAECDLTKDARIILFRLPTHEVVWWNRNANTYRVLTAPRTSFFEVTLSEARNQFYIHSAIRPEDPFTKPTPEETAKRSKPIQLDALRDIRTYELSTGALLSVAEQVAEQVRVGESVQNPPDVRVAPGRNRVASNEGMILDYATSGAPDSRRWKITLPPYESMPTQSMVSSLALLAVALVSFALKRFKPSVANFTCLLVALTWPLVLTGIERGFSSDPHANSLSALAGVILLGLCSFCCAQILTRERPLPWLSLLPWCIFALLAVAGAISEEYFYWAKSLNQFFGLPEN